MSLRRHSLAGLRGVRSLSGWANVHLPNKLVYEFDTTYEIDGIDDVDIPSNNIVVAGNNPGTKVAVVDRDWAYSGGPRVYIYDDSSRSITLTTSPPGFAYERSFSTGFTMKSNRVAFVCGNTNKFCIFDLDTETWDIRSVSGSVTNGLTLYGYNEDFAVIGRMDAPEPFIYKVSTIDGSTELIDSSLPNQLYLTDMYPSLEEDEVSFMLYAYEPEIPPSEWDWLMVNISSSGILSHTLRVAPPDGYGTSFGHSQYDGVLLETLYPDGGGSLIQRVISFDGSLVDSDITNFFGPIPSNSDYTFKGIEYTYGAILSVFYETAWYTEFIADPSSYTIEDVINHSTCFVWDEGKWYAAPSAYEALLRAFTSPAGKLRIEHRTNSRSSYSVGNFDPPGFLLTQSGKLTIHQPPINV